MDIIDFKNHIEKLLEERKNLHINDPVVYEHWERIADAFGKNEVLTIEYLDQCDEDTVVWISEVFEDISAKLRSREYIKCLERLDKKYPNQNLKPFVDDARNFFDHSTGSNLEK